MNFENQLVSVIANNPELLNTVTVLPEHFSNPRTGRVFKTVIDLISDKKEPDIIMLAETLGKETGEEWLNLVDEILTYPGIAKNLPSYESAIQDDYRQRILKGIGYSIIQEVEQGDSSALTNAINALRSLDDISQTEIGEMKPILTEVVKRIDALSTGKIKPGITTGLTQLDKFIGGLQGGDSIILAARTSIGKTAMMCNLAVNAKVPVGIISGEQSRDQIVIRMLAKLGSVSSFRLKTGKLHREDWEKLTIGVERLTEAPIFIIDKPRPKISDIEQFARKLKWKHNIEALYIDYLQLIANPDYPDMRIKISDISKRIKALAMELDIPIVTLAQLNRGAVGRLPELSDMKESGSIEEDADIAILLYRPANEDESELIMDIKKNRDGPTCFFGVNWNASYMQVSDKNEE